jgi:hypothetical protein
MADIGRCRLELLLQKSDDDLASVLLERIQGEQEKN